MDKAPKFIRNLANLRSTDRPGLNFLYLSAALVIVGGIAFSVIVFRASTGHNIRALGPVLLSLFAATALLLLVRGHRLAAGRVMVYGAWLTLAATAVIGGGPNSPGPNVSVLIVVMAGWVLGKRHALLLAGATILTTLLLAQGELAGFLPLWPQGAVPPMARWFSQSVIIAVATVLIIYVLRTYDDRFRLVRQIAENVPAMIFHGDRELRCRYANRRYAEFYGCSEAGIIGMNLRDILGASVFGSVREKLDQVLAGETVSYRGVRRHAATGDERELEVTLTPDVSPQGKVEGFYAMVTDITDRLRAEDGMRRSQEKFAKAFHLMPLASAIVSTSDGRFIEVNKAWERLLGWQRDEAVGHTALELALWPSPGERVNSLAKLIHDGRVDSDEVDIHTRSGDCRRLLISSELIDIDGAPCSLSMGLDITERQRMEEALRRSEEKFSKAFHLNPLTVAIVRQRDGHFLEVNRAWEELLGWSREEALGKTSLELGIWPDSTLRAAWVTDLRRNGNVKDVEIEFHTRNGEVRHVLLSADLIDLEGELCSLGMAVDITERKKMEEALRRSEDQFAKAFRSSPLPITISRLSDGRYIDVNDAALNNFGWTRAETIARSSLDLKIWPSTEERARWMTRLTEDGRVRNFEATLLNRAGAPLSVLISSEKVLLDGEECVLSLIYDFTDRRRMEESLRSSEEKLAKMFHASPVAISLSRLRDGRYVDVNEAYITQYGWSREEMIGHTSTELGLWDKEARGRWIDELRTTGRTQGFEATFRTRSGKLHSVLVSAERVDLDAEECVISLVYDITARKRAEEALRQSEARARVMAQESSIGIFLCAADGETIYTNPAIHRIIGCEADEAQGDRWTEHIHPEDRESTRQAWHAAIAKHLGYELDYRFLRKDGSVRFVHVKAMAVNEDGKLLCYVGNVEDTTDRKRAEEEILRLNAELEHRVQSRTSELLAANRELESFAYSISHDLRAPLRGIDGFSQLLLDEYGGTLDRQGRDYLSRVRRAAQRMGILIDDLLNLSRVTRQGMRRETVDLSQLAGDILDEFRKAHPLRVVDICVAADCQVEGDPQLLRVLLENLLDNAWKYTSKTADAQIEFGVDTSGPEPAYFVRDNGAGFDMQYADRLFRPFQRLHSSEDFEGSGVGLASVARVVARHGGRVWAESIVGSGAIFRFILGHQVDS